MSILLRLREYARRQWRGGHYPLLLPHFRIVAGGLQPLCGDFRPMPRPILQALAMCDGTRTLAQVARAAGVKRAELLQQHEAGSLLLWRAPARPINEAGGDIGQPRHIILSPHPDDAPLSLGGWILDVRRRGEQVLIVNVFSKTAAWRFPGAAGRVDEVQAIRRAEEALMARLTGARLHHMELPEAMLRGHSLEQIFTASPGESDTGAASEIAAGVARLATKYPEAQWRLPLAIGNHIDHRLTRDGGAQGLRAAAVPGDRICFYEDLPYAAKVAAKPEPAAVASLQPIAGLLRWKLELLRIYWSQLTWPQIVEVGDYATSIGGERVWLAKNAVVFPA